MPCFEPVLTIAAGRPLLDHVGRESLHPVDHAPEVDVDDAPPAGRIAEQFAASAGPGVVHQHGDFTESVEDRGLQAPDVFEVADVDGEGSHMVRLRVAVARTFAAPASSASPLKSAMHTFMPSAANLAEAARPMPLAAPVMTATRFAASAG